MQRVSHILFDLDGTLTDPMPGITASIRYALRTMEAHVPEPQELLWCIGPPLRGSFATLLQCEDEATLQRAIALYRECFSAIGMYENALYDGIEMLLAELKTSGTKLYLATSKPLFFAEQILRHFGLDTYFDGAYGSALDGGLSNKAELIAHLLESESIDPASAVMVGG
jgi:phosphoglycolate phosphatase